MHPLWLYKHQHDNRVRSKLFVVCQRWCYQWRFAAILVNCAPSGEMHNYCTLHVIKEDFENFSIHRCNYILLSQVYRVWQVVKTPTIISNNPVFYWIVYWLTRNNNLNDNKKPICCTALSHSILNETNSHQLKTKEWNWKYLTACRWFSVTIGPEIMLPVMSHTVPYQIAVCVLSALKQTL